MPKRLMCDPQLFEKDLSGRIYVITGANSGVGLETTRQLVKQGAHVVMACRRVDAGKEVAESFQGLNGSFDVIACDLADLQSVRDFAEAFLSKNNRLDGLVCNAGMVVMENTPKHTKDGFELTWASSYFGHFLLTELLLDTIKASVPARIAIISSVVHAGNKNDRPTIHLDDLNYEKREFNNFSAYAEAKLANILYAKELASRLEGTGVTTASIHPGWARSNFGRGGNLMMRTLMSVMRPLTRYVSDSNWESAQTSLHVLLSDDAPNHSGAYFSQHSVLYRDKEYRAGGWPLESPNPNAHDMELAQKLVARTRDLVGLDNV